MGVTCLGDFLTQKVKLHIFPLIYCLLELNILSTPKPHSYSVRLPLLLNVGMTGPTRTVLG